MELFKEFRGSIFMVKFSELLWNERLVEGGNSLLKNKVLGLKFDIWSFSFSINIFFKMEDVFGDIDLF